MRDCLIQKLADPGLQMAKLIFGGFVKLHYGLKNFP